VYLSLKEGIIEDKYPKISKFTSEKKNKKLPAVFHLKRYSLSSCSTVIKTTQKISLV